MKTCPKCGIEKPKAWFSKCASKKSGLQSKCKSCDIEYRAANREKIAEWMRIHYKANTGKIAAQRSMYKKSNPEKVAAQRRKYRSDNVEACRARVSEWAKENHDKRASSARNRRAMKRNADGTHTAAEIRAIFENQRGLCANCQAKLFKSGAKKYHVDHIMPLKLGGSNWPSNLQCLCPSCNLSKGAKHPDDWASEQGRLI